MSIKLKVYVSIIILLGFTCLYFGIINITKDNMFLMLFFSGLILVSEAAAVPFNSNLYVSVSFGIGVASILIFQSPMVSIIGFLPMVFSVQVIDGKLEHIFNTSFIKRLFNGCSFSISLFASNQVYLYVSKLFEEINFISYNIPGILILVATFCFLDATIFTILLSIIENNSFFNLINKDTWLIFVVDLIAFAPFGVIIATLYVKYGVFAVILFFGPLLIARFSFKLYVDMKKMYSETISALSNAVDAKDQYTSGHSHRVAEYAVEIAKRMGFNEAQIDKIRTAAILHDIGKIGVNENILNKPGKLEEHEFVEIRKHPEIGYNILLQVSNLSEVAKIIMYHHERYDGGGYPRGIGNDQVPIESYIISVSDAYDAMTTNRPYRPALDSDVAIQIIIDEAGKQFHPDVVKAFVRYMGYTEERLIYAS